MSYHTDRGIMPNPLLTSQNQRQQKSYLSSPLSKDRPIHVMPPRFSPSDACFRHPLPNSPSHGFVTPSSSNAGPLNFIQTQGFVSFTPSTNTVLPDKWSVSYSYVKQEPCFDESQKSDYFSSDHSQTVEFDTRLPSNTSNITHGPQSFPCPLCQNQFTTESQISDHVRSVHGKCICVPCNKVFNSNASLSYHRNVKHGNKGHLKCEMCGKNFGHKQHMRSHMFNVHKIDPQLNMTYN